MTSPRVKSIDTPIGRQEKFSDLNFGDIVTLSQPVSSRNSLRAPAMMLASNEASFRSEKSRDPDPEGAQFPTFPGDRFFLW